MKASLCLAAVGLLLTTHSGAQDSDAIVDFVDARYESTAEVARRIWEFAEVGYQETASSELLQLALGDAGFTIEAGVASIPTAFVATYGSGEPVIAIMAGVRCLARHQPGCGPQPPGA